MGMEKQTTDAHLIRAYLSGKDHAFEKLFRRYERPLFTFILRFVGDRQVSEDMFQQTWLKVIRALPQYEERGSFSSWLFGIANNCCVDQVRKKRRSRVDDLTSSEGMDRLPDEDSDPEETLLKQEQVSWLEKAVERLPVEQRQVVLMRLFGEIPFKEIARIVECPLNTVLGRMHYAIKNLRKIVEQEYGGEYQNVLS
jgi:RNA polymerase sigma-70 factor (ECF subfamily)